MSGQTQERRIFVCVKKRNEREASCGGQGSLELIANMREMLAKEGIPGSELDIRPCGCLDLCEQGPVMMTVSGKAAEERKPPKIKEGKRGVLDPRVATKVEENELRELLQEALRS